MRAVQRSTACDAFFKTAEPNAKHKFSHRGRSPDPELLALTMQGLGFVTTTACQMRRRMLMKMHRTRRLMGRQMRLTIRRRVKIMMRMMRMRMRKRTRAMTRIKRTRWRRRMRRMRVEKVKSDNVR